MFTSYVTDPSLPKVCVCVCVTQGVTKCDAQCVTQCVSYKTSSFSGFTFFCSVLASLSVRNENPMDPETVAVPPDVRRLQAGR